MSMNLEQPTQLLPLTRFYSAYSEKLFIGMSFPVDSLVTDQSFREECDINTIMARYQSTGELPQLNTQYAQYLDVTGMDFQEHMDFIIQAQGLFDELPSSIRDRFGNDPAAFLDFTSDPENRTEMAKMGLLSDDATRAILNPPTPTPAPVGDPTE